MLLLLLILGVYLPYVLRGGLIRDDLGFVTTPRDFPSYPAFQSYLSSFVTMTARPVSAVLHGLCYWFLGSTAWAHHAVNLALFAASVLLVHEALRRLLDPGLALAACAFVAVYPTASGTVFSSMMMNSNLAGALWAAALWLVTLRTAPAWSGGGAAVLLVLSGLSYESFIPLFPAVALAGVAAEPGPWTRDRVLRASIPVLVAIAGIGLYRLLLERLLFYPSFTRAAIPHDLFGRLVSVPLDGVRVAYVGAIQVSVRSLRDIPLIPPIALAALLGALVPLLIILERSLPERRPGHRVLIIGVCAFVAAHAIFVFSDYHPTAHGFESRTQGAIRFAAGFLLASALVWATAARAAWARSVGRISCLGLLTLFTLGTVGQREAWIEAARYNRGIVEEISSAIRSAGFAGRDSLTLVAVLDRRFRQSVNGEPTFRTSWDLGPALELAHPGMRIRANVYEAKRASVGPDGVTLDGSWRAAFPFQVFRTGQGAIREVRSEQEWTEVLQASGHPPG